MSGLFLKLLNMSISASVLIVVVVLARCLLRKSPKWIHCILWALVGIRLLCPFQLETTFSLAPNAQVVSIEAGAVTSQVLAEMPALDNTANRYLAKYYFEGITVPEQAQCLISYLLDHNLLPQTLLQWLSRLHLIF